MFVALRLVGTGPLMGAAMRSMFARTPRADPSVAVELAPWQERMRANDPAGVIRFGNAIFARDDVLDQLHRLNVPSLVVVGEEDRALPVRHSRRIANALPGARFSIIRRAGHLGTIENPAAVNAVLVPSIEGAA